VSPDGGLRGGLWEEGKGRKSKKLEGGTSKVMNRFQAGVDVAELGLEGGKRESSASEGFRRYFSRRESSQNLEEKIRLRVL